MLFEKSFSCQALHVKKRSFKHVRYKKKVKVKQKLLKM